LSFRLNYITSRRSRLLNTWHRGGNRYRSWNVIIIIFRLFLNNHFIYWHSNINFLLLFLSYRGTNCFFNLNHLFNYRFFLNNNSHNFNFFCFNIIISLTLFLWAFFSITLTSTFSFRWRFFPTWIWYLNTWDLNLSSWSYCFLNWSGIFCYYFWFFFLPWFLRSSWRSWLCFKTKQLVIKNIFLDKNLPNFPLNILENHFFLFFLLTLKTRYSSIALLSFPYGFLSLFWTVPFGVFT